MRGVTRYTCSGGTAALGTRARIVFSPFSFSPPLNAPGPLTAPSGLCQEIGSVGESTWKKLISFHTCKPAQGHQLSAHKTARGAALCAQPVYHSPSTCQKTRRGSVRTPTNLEVASPQMSPILSAGGPLRAKSSPRTEG